MGKLTKTVLKVAAVTATVTAAAYVLKRSGIVRLELPDRPEPFRLRETEPEKPRKNIFRSSDIERADRYDAQLERGGAVLAGAFDLEFAEPET